MGINDNKTLSWNVSGKQLLGIVVLFALCFAAIWADALIVGYVVLTLALCAFFLVVAFDMGLARRADDLAPSASEVAAPVAGATTAATGPAGAPARRRAREI